MLTPAFGSSTAPLLVIGYGNTLRQDDGVGPRVAGLVADLELPGVEALACAQLSPEHADAVARAHTVVFVDAQWGDTGPVRLRRLTPGKSAQVTTHAVEPRTLLALAREVYGRAPHAWMLTLPARNMDFGEELSEVARLGIDDALRVLDRFVQLRQLRKSTPRGEGSDRLVSH